LRTMERAVISLCVFCLADRPGLVHVQDRIDCLFDPVDATFEV
jgi:hypothetical protein